MSKKKPNVIIRGWSGSVLKFEERFYERVDLLTVGPLVLETVKRHLAAVGPVHMIEFEFPELPESERFFRLGTDPTRMVDAAVVVRSENSEKVLSCPRCGGLGDRVTNTRAADRLVCRDCGLAYLPDEWLREFYGGLKPK